MQELFSLEEVRKILYLPANENTVASLMSNMILSSHVAGDQGLSYLLEVQGRAGFRGATKQKNTLLIGKHIPITHSQQLFHSRSRQGHKKHIIIAYTRTKQSCATSLAALFF